MVSTALESDPIRGVGCFFQAGAVVRGGLAIWDHEFTIHQPDGRTVPRAFPRIARGPQEYEAFTREHLGCPESAQC